MTTRLLPLLSLALLVGCVVNGDKWPRPRDLSPAWLIDRPRLLAVRAEPPDALPGQEVTFEALLATPPDEEAMTRVWFACPPEDPGGIGFGCFLDLGSFDDSDPSELLEEGLIGVEPGLPPAYTIPADTLDGLSDPWERQRGRQILVQVAALPPDFEPGAEVDFAKLEVGYKRVVVRDTDAPNRNPEIASLAVDGHDLPPDSTLLVEAGQTYTLHLYLADDAVETYPYLTREGVEEERTEAPWANWYTTGGTLTRPTTLHPYTYTDWEAPDAGERGTFHVVVRDRRGGMTWWSQDWEVRP